MQRHMMLVVQVLLAASCVAAQAFYRSLDISMQCVL